MNLAQVLAGFPALRSTGAASSRRSPVRSTAVATGVAARASAAGVDLRDATPHQIAALSLELHLAGELSFEDSAWLGRPPELHAAYARTVGRLLGDTAGPHRRQDQVRVWEARLAFAEHHCGDRRAELDRLRRIVLALRRFERRGRHLLAPLSRPAA